MTEDEKELLKLVLEDDQTVREIMEVLKDTRADDMDHDRFQEDFLEQVIGWEAPSHLQGLWRHWMEQAPWNGVTQHIWTDGELWRDAVARREWPTTD